MSPWVLEEGVLHLNHGSFGATDRLRCWRPSSGCAAGWRPTPRGNFLGGEYQRELDAARRAVADLRGR